MAASASERSTSQAAADDRPVTAPAPLVERDLGRWKEFLRAQEALCAEHGFLAAVLTIGVDREADMARTIEVLSSRLRSTDRAGVLAAMPRVEHDGWPAG